MHESLAIVGMDCRLPGADGLEAFWNLVFSGGTAWGRLPESRLPRDLYFDPEKGRVGKSYSELGALVADRPIDPAVCPLRPEMLDRFDVAHHVFLEVASRACRDAGLDPFAMPRQRRTGVYVGHTGGSTRIGDFVYGTGIDGTMTWLEGLEAARVVLGADAAAVAAEVTAAVRRDHPGRRPGQTLDLVALGAAQIVNEALGLEGPYLVVDAACASSLQALAIAARALREGAIDQAIVGGASYCKSDSLVLFSAAQSVSNTGSCPFGRAADGLVTAEGYVALVVKTLSRAVADGDRIRAVIQGIGVASDGKGKSLWAPRQEGQKLAVERAYPDLRDLARLDYIEAHATSTQVGDATELGALSSLLSAQLPSGRQVPIGSVKANIGHTLETAGMASLVKVVLAMEHGVIPPGSTCTDYNDEFDWRHGPFMVPREPLAWPRHDAGTPRRAAVNAFGIGGLNVHLAIAEHLPGGSAPARPVAVPAADDDRAVAIVGMGSVLPGGLTADAFRALLESGGSAVGPVPAARWNAARALDPSGPRTWHTIADRGGFIDGFAYDWRRHKVPPKQIAAANPLQFMLLEAADAAIAAGGGMGSLDRIRTAVVVGTMFGGEFAHDLQMGLRLPETMRHLRGALARRGVAAADVARIVEAYQKRLLEKMPALIDETGSFTSSTLASRLTKSFDLMGGALALDCGDCSGASAIAAAVDMLRQRDCDAVVCAAGQRCLDLVAFEGLSLSGGLSDGTAAPFASSRRGRVPGEGAVVLLLKRLSDARAAGNHIHGVIRGVTVAAGSSLATTLGHVTHEARVQGGVPAPGVAALELVTAGQPDADAELVAALAAEYGGERIAGTIEGAVGHVGAAAVAAGVMKMTWALENGRMPPTVGAGGASAATGALRLTASAAEPLPTLGPAGYRAGGITVVHGNQAAHLVIDNGRPVPAAAAAEPVPVTRPAAAAVSQPTPLAVSQRAPSAVPQPARAARPGNGLVAAIFPGQGSQYADMFRSLTGESAATKSCLDSLDADARAAGCETLADVAWRQPNGLGTVVWDTQWSMFLGDLLAWRVLEGMGFDPDVIASHSFGEFPALVAAGAWTVADGARATRARAEAVDACGPRLGAMLSVIAGRADVAAALATFPGQVWLCAENAPEQSVIGGHARAVDAVEVLLEGRRVRSKRLAVPSPFHTPLLADAADRLAETIDRLPITEPRRRIYGSTTAAPLVSAADVRESLVRQMTQTVRWVDLVERLWADGVRTFVEVGPSGVLTGLVRRILEGREGATFIQFDQRGRDAAGHLEKVREQLAAAGALGGLTPQTAERSHAPAGSVVHFDATARRRARNRSGAGARPVPAAVSERAPAAAPEHAAASAARPADGHGGHVDRRQTAAVVTPRAPVAPGVNRLAAAPPASSAAGETAPSIPAIEQTLAALAADYGVRLPLASLPDRGGEFLAALAELFEVGPSESERLRQVATFHDAAAILARGAGKTAWLDRPAEAGVAGAAGHAAAGVEAYLVEFVVEQTGYPREIVELDADLEGDLGIDSIRKAQLFGEIGQKYGLSADASVSLDDFRTLRHLLDYMLPRIGGTPSVRQAAVVSNGAARGHGTAGHDDGGGRVYGQEDRRVPAPAATAVLVEAEPRGAAAANLEAFLIDFVVEQTGYPREIVELDADLEGDLGIDSIRKAQLFGEIGQKYGLSADASVSLDDFRTLRHLLDYMLPRVGGGASTSDSATARAGSVAGVASPNGHAAAARESHAANGHAANGHAANGHAANGHAANGHAANGHAANGHAANGHAANGHAANGHVHADNGRANGHAVTGSPAATAAPASAAADLEAFLIDFVIEQTGYPREIVELDADLEGDLGIDSIRKAQLFGEIGQKYGLSADASVSLDDFRTLRHLLDYMLPRVGGGASTSDSATARAGSVAGVASPNGHAAAARESHAANGHAANGHAANGHAANGHAANGHAANGHAANGHAANGHAANGHAANGHVHADNGRANGHAVTGSPAATAAPASAAADLEAFLIDFVIEQTGYPREIVELDADLEGDLGIDSIRKAQLFGEIGQKYGLSADASVSLDDFRTLRHLLDYMLPRVGGGQPAAPAAPVAAPPAVAVSEELATAIRLWVRQIALSGPRAPIAGDAIRLPTDVAARIEGTAAAVGVDASLLRSALVNPVAALGGFDVALNASSAAADGGLAIGFGRHAAPTCIPLDATAAAGFIVGVAGLPGGLVSWNDAGLIVIARPAATPAAGSTPVACAVQLVAGCRTPAEAAAAIAAVAPLAGSLVLLPVGAGQVHEIAADGRLRAIGSAWRECAANAPLVKVAGDGAGGVAVGRVLADAAGVGVRDGLSATATWMAAGVTPAGSVAFAGGPQGNWLPAAAVDLLAAAWNPIVAPLPAAEVPPAGGFVTGRFSVAAADLDLPAPVRDLAGERVAILAGSGPAADELARRLSAAVAASGGRPTVLVAGTGADTLAALAAAEEQGAVRHLLIATPFTAPAAWVAGREQQIAAAYFACQRWLATRTRAGDAGRSTLTAVTALGGDFGLSGSIGSPVGGAFAGLFKGLAREYPDVQMRVVDFAPTAAAADVAARVGDEICRPGPVEIGWQDGRRLTVVAVERPPRSAGRLAGLAAGSVWLVTGGARGVTAACARALGSRHGLPLVLVGSTRPAAVEEAWLSLDEDRLKPVKSRVMLDAKAAGADPRKAWREIEKSIEINRELARFRAAGVTVRYECCDLADAAAVRALVHRVQREVGPIRGLVHGAGWESACKFEKKTAAGLEATLGPKCVGLENVLAAIDPGALESVVAFGSTSGRLGGLGQADYSLANDMLAKIVGRLRRERPHVRGTVFHWHAWDEVGMASRPESRFVLEQFGMKFMPLAEGVGRFLAEIEAGLPEAEVLVTEHVFCLGAAPVAPATQGETAATPVVGSLVAGVERTANGATVAFRLDPRSDRFLVEHTQYGRPLLPAVMGAELLAQAAGAAGLCDRVTEICDFLVEWPIAFPTDAERIVHVDVTAAGGRIEARARMAGGGTGTTAGLDRIHLSGVLAGTAAPIESRCSQPPLPFFPTAYSDEAPLRHGPAFRTLGALFFDRSGGWARLTAPDENVVAAPRGAAGWTVPVALLDGCIVACGYYSHVMCGQRVEIPRRFERLRVLARPRAGEACTARILFRSQDAKVTVYDFVLFGADERPLLAIDGLHLAVMAAERSPT